MPAKELRGQKGFRIQLRSLPIQVRGMSVPEAWSLKGLDAENAGALRNPTSRSRNRPRQEQTYPQEYDEMR